MNIRENVMAILRYQPYDSLPVLHFGYWKELLDEWAQLGKISKELAANAGNYKSQAARELDSLIGWDFGWEMIYGPANGLMPGFEQKVLEVLPDGNFNLSGSV